MNLEGKSRKIQVKLQIIIALILFVNEKRLALLQKAADKFYEFRIFRNVVFFTNVSIPDPFAQ